LVQPRHLPKRGVKAEKIFSQNFFKKNFFWGHSILILLFYPFIIIGVNKKFHPSKICSCSPLLPPPHLSSPLPTVKNPTGYVPGLNSVETNAFSLDEI